MNKLLKFKCALLDEMFSRASISVNGFPPTVNTIYIDTNQVHHTRTIVFHDHVHRSKDIYNLAVRNMENLEPVV